LVHREDVGRVLTLHTRYCPLPGPEQNGGWFTGIITRAFECHLWREGRAEALNYGKEEMEGQGGSPELRGVLTRVPYIFTKTPIKKEEVK
jgi:hypothetical protein